MADPTTGAPVLDSSVTSTNINGGNTSQNGPRRWEKPWSLQEIHADAGAWTLAGDAGLLEHLQEFSQRMISHTHQIGKEVDDLLHDAKLMDVRVNNVINDFIMLANTQFVENRVYDEDITEEITNKEEKKIEQEKTKEQRELELIPRVALALKLGVDVIDNSFEKLDTKVVDSDSEEEDNVGIAEAILEAKDPYVTRPLPYLIGTPQFMEDDNIGLIDDLSEPESDQGSISVSESGDEESEESQQEYSTSDESDEDNRKKTSEGKKKEQPASSTDVSDDSDQDMFSAKRSRSSHDSGDVSASDEEEPQRKPTLPTGIPKDFSSELASRLGVAAPKQATERTRSVADEDGWKERSNEQIRKDSTSSVKQTKDGKKDKGRLEIKTDKSKDKLSKPAFEDNNLFGQDDRQDEEDDLFSKDGGLFSSSKGLFDDDDERGLFGDVKKPAVKAPQAKTEEKSKKKEDVLFADDFQDEDSEEDPMAPLLISQSSSIHTVKKPTAQPAATTGKSVAKGGDGGNIAGGLFAESEDENDLFGHPSDKSGPTKTLVTPAAKISDLFADDDDDDDLFGSMAASTVKNKTHGNVGLTVEGYDEVGRVEEKKLEDEQLRKKATPEKKLPPGAVSMFGKGSNPIVEALKKQQQAPASSDEDESVTIATEDQSSRNSSVSSISSTHKVNEETQKKISSLGTNILAGSIDEDDLFVTKPNRKPSVETDRNITKNTEANTKKSDKSKLSKDSLFDSGSDDNDVDIFSSVIKPLDSKKSDKFSNSSAGGIKSEKETPAKPSPQSNKMSKGSSLFDDEEDDDDDDPLFSSKPSQFVGPGNQTSKNKTQGLFTEDDFQSMQDENPSVDLFSNKKPLVQKKDLPQQPVDPAAKKVATAARPIVTNLFHDEDCDDDDDDDGDLFSVQQVKSSATKPVLPTEIESSGDHIDKGPKKEAKTATPTSAGLDPLEVSEKMKSPVITEKNNEDVKKEGKKTTSEDSKVVKPFSKASGLFGGDDDDDDDDLFSPKKSVKAKTEVIAATIVADVPVEKKEARPESKPKKPAGSVSIFGSVDPSSFIKKEKVLDEKVEALASENKKPHPPQIAAKPPIVKEKPPNLVQSKSLGSADLFDDGGDDSNDLFVVTTNKATPPPIATKLQAPPTGPTTATKEQTEIPKQTAFPENSQGKIPTGAVSLFAGNDLFVAKQKTSSSETEHKNETSSSKETPAHVPLSGNDPLSVLTSPVNAATNNIKSVASNILGKVKVHKSSNTSLNSAPLDFDQPIDTETLTSASKDRPKLNRRRPQSRKARVQAAALTGTDFEDSVPPPIISISAAQAGPSPLQNKTVQPPPVKNSTSLIQSDHLESSEEVPSKSSFDLFGKDDLSKEPATLEENLQTHPVPGNSSDELFTRSLFNGDHTKIGKNLSEDLFSDLSSHEPNLGLHKPEGFSKLSKHVPEGFSNLSNQDPDDCSGLDTTDSPGTKSSPKKSETANVKSKILSDLISSKIYNSTPDDLSSVLANENRNWHPANSMSTKTVSKLSSNPKDDSLFGSTGGKSKHEPVGAARDDDDLFSALQPASQTGHKTADIFDDDDVDIFRSSTINKHKDSKSKPSSGTTKEEVKDIKKSTDSTNARPKRAATKDSSLFNDTTDIFSDIPSPVSKETKKRTPKKVVNKKVLQEDIDDIFADSNAVTIKPKRDAKNKIHKPARKTSENIFDDPLS